MALDRILFRAGAALRVVKGKGGPIPQKNLLAITIKGDPCRSSNFYFARLRPESGRGHRANVVWSVDCHPLQRGRSCE